MIYGSSYFFLHDYITKGGYLFCAGLMVVIYGVTIGLVKCFYKKKLQKGFEEVKDLVRGSIIAPPREVW